MKTDGRKNQAALCPVCRLTVKVNVASGRISFHGPPGNRCRASGQIPAARTEIIDVIYQSAGATQSGLSEERSAR